jgi:ribulose-bisphosphate carboxylase large chain
MYAFNITDSFDEMRRHHDAVLSAGGTCVMVNLNSVGLSALVALRRHSQLPIHGHRAGWALLTRCDALGMDFQPYQLLHRLAGVDQLHVSGLGGKFWEDDDSVRRSARACMEPIDGRRGADDDRAMPVFSGGSSVLEAKPTFDCAGGADLIYATGGAVFGHPDGVAAGVASLREAWEAAMQGVDLADYAEGRPHLATAIAQRDRQLAQRRGEATTSP